MHAKILIRWSALLGFILVLFFAGSTQAQKIPLRSKVELTAQGGVQFKAPKWIVTGPQKPDVAVLRNDKLKGQGAPLLLMLSVEQGPKATPDWNVIRKNIVDAARENKTSLKLSLKEDFNGVPGASGKRMVGSLIEESEILSVQLIALYKEGRLATVTLVSTPAEGDGQDLVGEVAASTTFLAKP